MRAAFIVSLLLHTLVISLVLWHPTTKQSTGTVMHVTLTPSNRLFSRSNSTNQQENLFHQLKKKHNGYLSKSYRSLHHNQATQQQQGNYHQLLILLHNKIQSAINQTSYRIPSFLRGRHLIIQFTTSPTGKISELSITRSSNTEQLDQLALMAVKSIKLPKSIKALLKKSETFKIKLVFD